MRHIGVIHFMGQISKLLILFVLLFLPWGARAECPPDSTCVLHRDLNIMLDTLEEKRCLLGSKPVLELDSITIVTDEKGRVYYSGSQPKPYRAHLHWCNYDLEFEGDLDVVVAQEEPEVWGFDFKLKFTGSFLFLDAVNRSPQSAVDVGLLWEFFHWRDVNLNVFTGFRSVGLGVGYDLTENFGVYGGYGFSFWTLRSNPQLGLYFGFW